MFGPRQKRQNSHSKHVPVHTHIYFYRSINVYTSAELLQEETQQIKAHTTKKETRQTSIELTQNLQKPNNNYHKTYAQNLPEAKYQVVEYILRRNGNRNKPLAIKEGAAVLALAHSD